MARSTDVTIAAGNDEIDAQSIDVSSTCIMYQTSPMHVENVNISTSISHKDTKINALHEHTLANVVKTPL